MVRRSASSDPPEGRSHVSERNDPPTIVNSTSAHNNKPTPRSAAKESESVSFAFRYEQVGGPSASDHREGLEESLSKENESLSYPHSKTISEFIVEVGSEHPSIDNKQNSQKLELNPGTGGGPGSALGKAEDLPESLLELSSNFKSSRKIPSQQERLSGTTPKPSLQFHQKQSARFVIENMPPTLPVPAETTGEPMSTSTPANATTDNNSISGALSTSGASASKTTYLTRKAHQFSNLKKKRNSTLLQKLFCSSENVEGTAQEPPTSVPTEVKEPINIAMVDSGIREDKDDVERIRAEVTPSHKEQEQQIQVQSKPVDRAVSTIVALNNGAVAPDDKQWDTGSGCMTFSDTLDITKDAFRLSAEADVRQSIQTAVAGALAAVTPIPDGSPEASRPAAVSDAVHIPPPSSTAQHVAVATTSAEEGKDDKDDRSIGSRHRWKPDNPAAIALKQKALEASRRAGTIVGGTPQKSKAVMSAPTASVPTPAGKPMFPSTIEYWENMTTGRKDGLPSGDSEGSTRRMLVLVDASESTSSTPLQETEVVLQESSVSENRDPEHENDKETDDRQKPSHSPNHQQLSQTLSGRHSVISAPSDEPTETNGSKSTPCSSIYDETDFLPNRVAERTPFKISSIEQQRSIQNADSEPQERRLTKRQQLIGREGKDLLGAKKSQDSLNGDRNPVMEKMELLNQELDKTKIELEKTRTELGRKEEELEMKDRELEIQKQKTGPDDASPRTESEYHTRLTEALAKTKVDAERQLLDQGLRWKEEHDVELKQIKRSYERKLLENKDQLSLANRKIRLQQEEVERLETQLRQDGKQPPSLSLASRHFERIDYDRMISEKEAEHKSVVEQLESELETTKEELAGANQKLQGEVEAVNMKNGDSAIQRDLDAVRRNLDEAKKTYQKQIESTKAKAADKEHIICRLQNELAEKEKELIIIKKKKTTGNDETILRLRNDLAAREKVITQLKESTLSQALRSDVEDLRKQVVGLEKDLAEEKNKYREREIALGDKEISLRKREKEVEERVLSVKTREENVEKSEASLKAREETMKETKTSVEKRETALRANHDELESRAKELESKTNEFEQSKKDMETERETIETMAARIKEEKSQVETLQKNLQLQRVEIETETKMARSHLTKSPLSTPSPSRTKRPTSIPRLTQRPEKDVEAHEREKESLRKKIIELEEKANVNAEEHKRTVDEIRSSSEKAVVRAREEMQATSEERRDRVSRERDELLARIKTLETEKTQSETALKELEHKEEELQKKISVLQEKAEERRDSESPEDQNPSISRESDELLARIEKLETEKIQRETTLKELEHKEEELQKKISVLEEQAEEAEKENERTLHNARKDSEGEITRLKSEIEQRLEQHMVRERELKDSLAQAESSDKAELLQQIEKLEEQKTEERSNGLREVQKKEDLLQRIEELKQQEQTLIEEHEQSLKDLKEWSNAQIEKLKEEMAAKEESFRSREKEMSNSLSETASSEKEELLKKIETLEGELEASKSASKLVTMKIAALEKENKAAEAAHIEEFAELQMKTSLEIKSLQDAVAVGGAPTSTFEMFNTEKEELLEQIRSMESQLQTEQLERVDKLEEFREQHSIHVEKLKRESAGKLEGARKEAESRVEELQHAHDFKIEELKRENELKIEELKRDHELKIEELESSYVGGSSNASYVASHELDQLKEKEKEQTEKISSMQAKVEEQKKEFEQQIKEVAESHAKELEDLISQLDLVEAEHLEKVSSKEKVAEQKDEIITALSNQLSEALDRMKSLEGSSKSASALQEDLRQAQGKIESLTSELEKHKQLHEDFLTESNELREKACDEAREEMIERAEGQFRQANELYVKLKKQYDASKGKVEKLSKELKEEKSKVETMMREREEAEAGLRAELAELKAQNAKVEALGAQKAKDYRREMEGLLKAAEDFEKKCKEAESNARAAKKTLAAVSAEKNELQQNLDTLMNEHEEMKQVCEELMAELEGRSHES